jgi:hypothetical protein
VFADVSALFTYQIVFVLGGPGALLLLLAHGAANLLV